MLSQWRFHSVSFNKRTFKESMSIDADEHRAMKMPKQESEYAADGQVLTHIEGQQSLRKTLCWPLSYPAVRTDVDCTSPSVNNHNTISSLHMNR